MTMLAPKIWSLNTVSYWKEPVILEEIADSRCGMANDKPRLDHLVILESKEAVHWLKVDNFTIKRKMTAIDWNTLIK